MKDEETEVDVISLGFHEVFDAVHRSILWGRFSRCGMSELMLHWVKIWLKDRA